MFGISLTVPLMGLTVLIAFFALILIVKNNYIKVAPNKVAIFYGRKRTMAGQTVGFKVVTGGSKVKLPIVEDVAYLDLTMFSMDLEVKGAPNKDGVLVNIRGVANVKILSDETSLMAACERFLGMNAEGIKQIAHNNLVGHLRSIVGHLSVEEIVSDRDKFNAEVMGQAAADLKKIGLGIDLLTIHDIDDEQGYIKALGMRRTAEVKRDAAIGSASAERESTIATTTATQEAATRARANEALMSLAEKERDVKKAQYRADVSREEATAQQAGPLAEAEAKKGVITKQREVATEVASLREQQLQAEVVKPAEASRDAAIAAAEGDSRAMIARATGEKEKKKLEGEGDAEAIRARGTAEADVIRLKLEGEAAGLLKKAEAMARLDASGRLLQVLEAAKEIIPAALRELAPVMAEVAKPLGNVSDIKLVSFGGGVNGTGGSALDQFSSVVPTTVAKMFEAFSALGIDFSGLLNGVKNGAGHTTEPEPPAAEA